MRYGGKLVFVNEIIILVDKRRFEADALSGDQRS